MKFTKQEAHKELVAQLTAKGEKLNLSERSIDEQLENLIPLIVTDETELADFVKKSLPFIKTADANVRNDVSVAIKDYKDKNPQPTPTPTPNDDKSDMEKRLLALEALNAKNERERKEKDAKKELRKAMKDKGIANEVFIDAMLEEVTITEDFDVSKKADSFLATYNKMTADSTSTRTPLGTNKDSERYDKEFEAIKALRERKLKEQGINN